MNIEWMKPGDLIPYPANAKLHPPAQVDHIANSIKQFGWQQPIVVDAENVVIIGHGRLLAAKQLMLDTVPVVRATDLTEDQVNALRLADNKTNESEWDFGKLEQELAELAIEGIDMAQFGFEVGEDFEDHSQEIVEDEAPEVQEEAKSKLGQIYQLGRHRLMCGDSTDAEAWILLMGGAKADVVFTDPPYGVAIGDKNATLNTVQKAGRCCKNIEGDTMSEADLYEMLKKAFINVRENCADDACYFVTSPQGGSLGLMMMMMMKDAGLEVRHVLMWEKNSPTFSLGRLDYDYQHEPIFYTWTKSHHNFRHGDYRSTIWKYDKPRKCDLHPTMKPVELVANAIRDGSEEGMIVLDAFCGSGTTIIAAEQTNRQARCMELDPHYVDVIIKRWENFTGEKAVLIHDPE